MSNLTKLTTLGLAITLTSTAPISSGANLNGGIRTWNDPTSWSTGSVPTLGETANAYANTTVAVNAAAFAASSDFGRTGNTVTMNISPSGSWTVGGGGHPTNAAWEGNIWMAWVHGTTNPDSATINVNGGSLSAFYINAGMQRAGDFAEINVNSGGSVDISQNLNWGQSTAGTSHNIIVDGAGSTFTVGNFMNMGGGISKLTLDNGGTITTPRIDYDDRDGAAFVVGASSTLNLGDGASHVFNHGLAVSATGTIGTGDNAVETATIANGNLTLNSGATIDYSINGLLETSDTWVTNGLTLSDGMTVNLIVDVVGGDVKQTSGPYDIFDTTTGGILGLTDFNTINWNITAADGTALKSTGTVELNGDFIQLVGFEAFAIPEPSTAMLLGMGAAVMALRRRVRR